LNKKSPIEPLFEFIHFKSRETNPKVISDTQRGKHPKTVQLSEEEKINFKTRRDLFYLRPTLCPSSRSGLCQNDIKDPKGIQTIMKIENPNLQLPYTTFCSTFNICLLPANVHKNNRKAV